MLNRGHDLERRGRRCRQHAFDDVNVLRGTGRRAVPFRRNGATPAAAIAYWLGNPMINPAVLVFLLFVTPWQWTLTQLLIGVVDAITHEEHAVTITCSWRTAATLSSGNRSARTLLIPT